MRLPEVVKPCISHHAECRDFCNGLPANGRGRGGRCCPVLLLGGARRPGYYGANVPLRFHSAPRLDAPGPENQGHTAACTNFRQN